TMANDRDAALAVEQAQQVELLVDARAAGQAVDLADCAQRAVDAYAQLGGRQAAPRRRRLDSAARYAVVAAGRQQRARALAVEQQHGVVSADLELQARRAEPEAAGDHHVAVVVAVTRGRVEPLERVAAV